MLLSTSLISILSSVVAISVSSKRRLPRPRAPFCLCPLTCKQPKPHSEPQLVANEQQIRTAAGSNDLLRAAGAGQGWEAPSRRTWRDGAVASTRKMWWLEPPACHKPGIDQHQHRALHRSAATGMTGIAVMRATGPLCRYAKHRLICFGGERRRHHRDSSQLHGITSGIVL